MPPLPLPQGASPPVGGAPIAAPSHSPGSEAAALAEVAQAVKVLQDAFGKLDPMGDPAKKVLDAIKKLSDVAPITKAAPGIGPEAMRNLASQAQKQAPLEMLLRQQAAQPPGGAA